MKAIYKSLIVSIFTIACVSVVSCKKSDPAPPDLADKLVGSYKVTAIGNLPNNLPAAPTAASVNVVRAGSALDQVQITAAYSITSTAGGQAISDSKTITLQQAGDNIDLYDGTAKVGNWNNNTIFASDYPFLTAKISFVATK
ncbi:hypothetical protein [Spirosoma sp. KNUC1025]|uniref:hypothetical protein n=1 Tax=Spirosoma sp. KNUC1025 TaxID=2894082 RepID=UPI00386ABFF1|nr:hypothetical protein LN737_11405 [Spirosoma sp. KNUC1025]